MKIWVATLAAAGFAVAVPAAAAGDSVYTKFDLGQCKVIREQEEGQSVELECPGHHGLVVYATEGDLRFDVDYGAPDGRWDSFGPFNSPHTTIEWRVTNGTPLAAIHRFFLDTGEGDAARKKQVLKISKVGSASKPGCPIAYVDASAHKNANLLARGAADMAPAFDCATDKPVIVGLSDGLKGLGIMSMNQ